MTPHVDTAANGHATQDLRRILAPLVIGAFLIVFTETSLAVGVPSIVTDLRVRADVAQWVSSAYMLTMASMIPASGFLMRRFGVRRQFLGAMAVFALGVGAAALAPSFPVLLAARIVQGAAAAAIMPTFIATIAARVPAHRRGAVMGLAVMVVSAAPALGPAISGIWIHHFGWRALFWLILAVTAVVLALGWFSLAPGDGQRTVPVDLWSVPLSFLAFGSTILGFNLIQRDGSTADWALLVAGLVFVAMFVVRQLRMARRQAPYLDVRIFHSSGFTFAVATSAAVSATLTSTVAIIPFLLQGVMHADTSTTGLAMLPAGITVACLAPLSGRLLDRYGAAPVILPATVIVFGSVVILALTPPTAGVWAVAAVYTVMHVGVAGLTAPMSSLALGAVAPDQAPDASAAYATSQQVAGAAGTAALIGVMQTVSGDGTVVTIGGVHAAFTVSVGITVVAFAAALGRVMVERRLADRR